MSRLLLSLGSFAIVVSAILFTVPEARAGGDSTPCAETDDCDGSCPDPNEGCGEEDDGFGCECEGEIA